MKKTLAIYREHFEATSVRAVRLQDDFDNDLKAAMKDARNASTEAMKHLNKSEDAVDEVLKSLDNAMQSIMDIIEAEGERNDEAKKAERRGMEISDAHDMAENLRDVLDDANGLFTRLIMQVKD